MLTNMPFLVKPAAKAVLMGLIHAVGLLAIYGLVMRVLTDSWSIAETEFLQLRWEMFAVLGTYGLLQATLSFFETLHLKSAKAMASSGLSSGAMIACCAHHLADLVPFLGFVQVFSIVTEYQSELMFFGAIVNSFVLGWIVVQNYSVLFFREEASQQKIVIL